MSRLTYDSAQKYKCVVCKTIAPKPIPPSEAPMSVRIGCEECRRPTKQRAVGGSGCIH